jgi:MFS transporter, putative metabolite transport protein
MSQPGGVAVPYDEAPLRPFHARVAVASFGGVFSDGFGLGIVGIALAQATTQLALTPLWLGLLGGASLAGLFLGALLTGPFADRHGRRPVFAYNMLLLAACAGLQFFATTAPQLLLLRLLIGFLLGTDYVVSKALLTEFTPGAFRGRVMSTLSVAWAGGYTCAYFVGYALSGSGDNAWRWMLACSAVPCMLILPLRLTLPESPLWLAAHGKQEQAGRIVQRYLGQNVCAPLPLAAQVTTAGRWAQLFSPAWRRRTLVACAFFTCQVIPYFAVGTFVTRVLDALDVGNSFVGGLAYNLSLLSGAVLGLMVVDRMPRRTFLVGSFAVTAAAMLWLVVATDPAPTTIVALFVIFAGVLSAASNLVYVYLPELFPTSLRASGIGLAIAASRIGSAASTFLLPVVVSRFGVHMALGACVGVLAFGGLICHAWAPETRHCKLDRMV